MRSKGAEVSKTIYIGDIAKILVDHDRANIDQVMAYWFVNKVFQEIEEALCRGERIVISDFGTMHSKAVKGKSGKRVYLRGGKAMKAALNQEET
tara:strand:- start:421 stop:702 length:282 start_codon:yes stop_codon:yes gene_type:complete